MNVLNMLIMLVFHECIKTIWEGVVEFRPRFDELTSEGPRGLTKIREGVISTIYTAYTNMQDLMLKPEIGLSPSPQEDKTEKLAFKVAQDDMTTEYDKNEFMAEARTLYYIQMATEGKISPKIYRSGLTHEERVL